MNAEAISSTAIRGSPEVGTPGREPKIAPRSELRPVETSPAPAPAAQQPSAEEVTQALEGVNAFLASGNSHIQFAMHKDSGQLMVSVIDDETSEVIKTFPSKELLDLASKIGELVGTLLDAKG